MFAAVVPARNEEGRIGITLGRLQRLPLDLIVAVVNGSTDQTAAEVDELRERRVLKVVYPEPLGLDVPRALGAQLALEHGATGVLFVDGDMAGDMEPALRMLMQTVKSGRQDMALTHVRRAPARDPASMAYRVTALRRDLNAALDLSLAGDAVACHGPHAVSRRLLEVIPLREVALPPVCQALAARAGLRVGVAASLAHADLRHRLRSPDHRRRVGETMIGDILEALRLVQGKPRSRWHDGRSWLGYHPQRRLDLLGPAALPSMAGGEDEPPVPPEEA